MRQSVRARVLAFTFACLVSMMSLEHGLLQGAEARPAQQQQLEPLASSSSSSSSSLDNTDTDDSRLVELNAFDNNNKHASRGEPVIKTASRMNMAEARKHGLLQSRLAVCPLPEFVVDNSDLFNRRTDEVNIRDIIKYWKILHKQMKLRYGNEELELALAGEPSRVRYDEVDRAFFELREYILCLATSDADN